MTAIAIETYSNIQSRKAQTHASSTVICSVVTLVGVNIHIVSYSTIHRKHIGNNVHIYTNIFYSGAFFFYIHVSISQVFQCQMYLKRKNTKWWTRANTNVARRIRQRKASPRNKFSISRLLLVITRFLCVFIPSLFFMCANTHASLYSLRKYNNGQTHGDHHTATHSSPEILESLSLSVACECFVMFFSLLMVGEWEHVSYFVHMKPMDDYERHQTNDGHCDFCSIDFL